RLGFFGVASGLKDRFAGFEIPVAELVPDEVIERAGAFIEAEFVDAARARLDGVREPREDPAVREELRSRRGAGERLAADMRQREADGVVELVAEVAIALDALRR